MKCTRCNRPILRAAWIVPGRVQSSFGPKCARLMGFGGKREKGPTIITARRRRRDDGQRDWVQEASQ